MSHAPAELTRLRPAHWLLLLAVSLAAFLPGFAIIAPFDRDESRYAQASHQMLETGDFVDIRFQDEARHKKPVGIYWMQSAAVSLLTGGETHGPIWMYRVPSLIGAVLAVLLTAWGGSRLFGATVGIAAGLAMATTVILGVEARMAKTDAVVLATVVAAQGALLRIYLDRLKPIAPGLGLVLVFWLAIGVSVLVKGPIGPMVSVGTVLALWAWDREAGWLKRLRPLLGLAVVLAVALPWVVAIWIKTDGAFFSYAVGHELIGKVHSVQEKHAGPPGYYLATFWLTFWPWSFLAALAVPWVWRRRTDPAVRFCVAWIVPTWLVFEVASTKLPHYTIIVFPAIAFLAMAALLERTSGSARRPGPLVYWPLALLFTVVGLAFAFAALYAPFHIALSFPPAGVAALTAIALTTLGVLILDRLGEPNRLMGVGVIGGLVAFGVIHGSVLPGISPMWVSPKVEAAVQRSRPCPGTVLAAAGYTEPSMVFLLGTATKLGGPEQVVDHLAADGTCGLGMVASGEDERRFLELAAERSLAVRQVDEVSGFNYSRGKPVVLRFYRVDPPPPPAG